MIERRDFLKTTAMAVAWSAAPNRLVAAADPAVRVNGDRLRRNLEGLSVFGRPAGGTFASGVSRTAYSDADVAGRKYVMELIRAAGLEPRIDAAGNIRASRAGDSQLKFILFGSHIDSVKNGGNFDGDVGSLGSIEVLQTFNEQSIRTRHPLELVIWSAEESNYGDGLTGSRAAASETHPGELERVQDGVIKRDAIRKIGGDPDHIERTRIQKGDFAAYLELHIEQGGTLDQAGIPIGVVEGIVGIDDYAVTVHGFSNHAGTTPMGQRKDALVAASEMVLAIRQIATAQPGRQVATVGIMQVAPGAPNVIPGEVKFTIDVRDLDGAKVAALGDEFQRRLRDIAVRNQCEVEITKTGGDKPALTAEPIRQAIERAADSLGLKHMRLPSGAGHDAQSMSLLGPIGMIFVPSIAGISHAPGERSRWEDIANGANVLAATILELDRG